MNRQMKRRLKRDPKALQEYSRTRDATKSVLLMLYVGMLYLHDKKGYGRKRLGDFVEGCCEILSAIDSEHIGFKDMQDAIYEETGVKIDLTGDYDEVI